MNISNLARPEHPGTRAAEILSLLAILAALFLLNVLLAFRLYHLGVTQQYNVIFDTDLVTRLSCFTTGWGDFGRNSVHPNLCNLVNPMVRIVAVAAAALRPHIASLMLRQEIALFVTPLAGAAQLALFYLTLRTLGVWRVTRLLLVLLYAASFSFLIFASVPDHFALGGLSVMLSLFAAARTLMTRRAHFWLWGIAGFLALGITVTNALAFFLLLIGSYLSIFDVRATLRRAAAICLVAGAATIAVAAGMTYVYHAAPVPPSRVTNWASHYFRPHLLENFASFPLALGAAVAPSGVMTEPNTFMTKQSRYNFQFEPVQPYDSIGGPTFLQIAFLLAVIGSLVLALRRRPGTDLRQVAAACGLILLFNGALHAVWGGDYFLFSQHWLGTAFVLAGLAPLCLPRRAAPALNGFLIVMIGATLADNFFLFQDMFRLLNAPHF